MYGSTRPGLPPGRIDISTLDRQTRIHSVKKDMDMNAHHVKLDIRNFRDEAASGVEREYRVVRDFFGDSHDEEQPLIQKQPTTRIDISEEAAASPSQHSFREEVGQAASRTFLCSRLALSLLGYLRVGYRWITKLLALGLYAVFLMPGFVQVGYQYFFSRNIHRGIVYGHHPRNRLDLYAPADVSSPKQVLIFITGGAWIIGNKAWGALLGIQLSERDVIVCSVDYRNFPLGNISDMVEDVSNGIGFIVNNIDQFGGDPDRYNLPTLVDHFHKWGLNRNMFFSVMGGEASLPLYSPELVVQSAAFAPAVPLLPPVYLFHGTGDYSITSDASESFGSVLHQVGATVATRLYPDKTHTDVILQDPMRGGHDALFDDFLAVLHADDEEAKGRDARAPLRPRLVPEFLLHLAHVISPF